ncbi:MAG: hypothetical protein KIS67_03155 [Verrucomicrobiae bacterium]|nr:hypothetical protein [Verrucomicrobiae bacterium]
MRTKTLAIAAAFLAAGLASSVAQSDVYSLNVVGYVNVPLTTGFNLIANPLSSGDNTLDTVIPDAGFGDTIYLYQSGAFVSSTYLGNWTPNLELAPGTGAFYLAGAASTVTFVGEVLQGELSNPIPTGFSLKSSQVPQSDTLENLQFPAGFGDTVYFYREGAYVSSTYLGSWVPELSPAVGEGFWVLSGAEANWTRTFSVEP